MRTSSKFYSAFDALLSICPIGKLQQMYKVAVVTKEFLAGLKTEGLVTMIRQHIISEWGAEGAEEKVLICNPCNLKTIFWTG